VLDEGERQINFDKQLKINKYYLRAIRRLELTQKNRIHDKLVCLDTLRRGRGQEINIAPEVGELFFS